MNISKLAAAPKLIKVSIKNEKLAAKYRKEFNMKPKELLEFYTWDRLPIDVYKKLLSVDVDRDAEVLETVIPLMLDETGKPIMSNNQILPMDVLSEAMVTITNILGEI